MIETGREFAPEEMLQAFLAHLEAAADGRQLLASWKRRDILLGRRVRLKLGEQEVTGASLGLDEGGALLLRDELGRIRRLTTGEVECLES